MRALLLLSVVVAVACSPSGPPSRPADITGVITNITPGAGSILIEERPQDTSGSAKLSLRIDANTRLWRMTGSRATPLPASDLRVGMVARAWVDGPIAESYPGQGKASDVAVDTAASSGELYLLSKGGPAVIVRVNGLEVARLACNGGGRIVPATAGVPGLPWQLEVARESDGRVLLSQTVGELPGWLLVQRDAAAISRSPVAGPFVPCP